MGLSRGQLRIQSRKSGRFIFHFRSIYHSDKLRCMRYHVEMRQLSETHDFSKYPGFKLKCNNPVEWNCSYG